MTIRLPRLLDAGLRERARLSPTRLTLDLQLRPLSTAVIYLPESDPAVAVRDLIELFDEAGSVGIFRVTGVDLQRGLTRTVYLEHSLATLADGVVPAMSLTGTPQSVIDRLLSHQAAMRWVLGDLDLPAETTVIFTCGCTNLLTALMNLIDMLPDTLMLQCEQSSQAWVMHLRQMSDADACEGRLSRNLSGVQIAMDASDLCTRVYPYGTGQGTERISLAPLTGTDWLESAAVSQWGRVCRTFTANTIFDVPTLKSVAEKYLERHSVPAVSVTADALDLSAMTGEDADSFRLGRMCRLAMPEYGMVMHERVTGLRKPDVFGAPGQVTVTLCSRVHDASDEIADMLREVMASHLIGGRVTDVTFENRAEGTAASPIVHYFHTEDWAAVLACTMRFDPDDGVRVVGVSVDGNEVPGVVYADGSFDALPYLKRNDLGVITAGRHTFTVFPSEGAVNTSVAMKVIEKI